MIKKFFTQNIKLKLVSLIIAILVWIYVIVLVQPEITIRISGIPVIYTNTINLNQQGYMLMNESESTVSVKIKGTRNMLASLEKNQITAVVDLSEYAQEGTFTPPITIRVPYENLTVTEKNPSNVRVIIDKKVTQQVPVSVYTEGTPATGYAAYKPVSSQNTINVSGPKSLISAISEAAVTINCDGATEDISKSCTPVFYNTSKNTIESDLITTEPKAVTVDCSILKKKSVPVKINVEHNNENFRHNVNLLSNNHVEILGYEDDLRNITSVSTETIYTAGISKDTTISARLLLPSGVVTADHSNEVSVEINVITE